MIDNLRVAVQAQPCALVEMGHLSTQQQNGYLAYGQGWDNGCFTSAYNVRGVMLFREMVQECIGPARG